jgi:pilus assembly protein Flp/PilA
MTGLVSRLISARVVKQFRADENGATAIEYAMIAAGIGATIAGTVWGLGSNLKETWWDKIGALFP